MGPTAFALRRQRVQEMPASARAGFSCGTRGSLRDCDTRNVWETPVGWRWAPAGIDEPEEFSDHYGTEAAAIAQALLWGEETGDDEEPWLE